MKKETFIDFDNIHFAVFNGGKEITPEMHEEVKRFIGHVAGLKQKSTSSQTPTTEMMLTSQLRIK